MYFLIKLLGSYLGSEYVRGYKDQVKEILSKST